MLISQTLSPIVTPGLREALLFGGERADWTRIFDEAAQYRHDDAVLRVLDSEARREEHRREQERKLIRCAPAPAAASVARPHIFRALFQKDVGSVIGASDVWCDTDFVAVDGVTGKLQSWVDYIDNAHLLTQVSSGAQCVLPAVSANFNNAKAVTCTGAEVYQSNRSVALWAYTSNGNGFTGYAPFRTSTVGAQVLYETITTGTQPGINHYVATPNCRFAIFRVGGTIVADKVIGTFVSNTASLARITHGTALSPQHSAKLSGIAVTTGSYSTSAAAGSCEKALTFLARAAGSLGLVGNATSLHSFRRGLGAAEVAVADSYLLWKYGTAA